MITKEYPVLRLHDERLREISRFWYLCSPYAKYPGGQKKAFKKANEAAAVLFKHGVPVFSPISHSHPVATVFDGYLDNRAHDIWMPFDLSMLRVSSGVLINPITGWRDSVGIEQELEQAEYHSHAVYILDVCS